MKTYLFRFLLLLLTAGFLPACMEDRMPESENAVPQDRLQTRAYGDKSPKLIAIVETNDTDPRNVLSYRIGASADAPALFDIVEFFAANINKGADGNPVIYLNPELAPLLADSATYIKPFRDAGVRVVLSILGNWQHIGVANMSETQADKFCDILVYIVKKYGLDGVSFDDEYADYDNLVSGSYGRIIRMLRAKLDAEFPDGHKMIGVDQWGNYGQIDAEAGAMIDYVYHGMMGSNVFVSSSSVAGVDDDRFSPQTINLRNSYSAISLNLIKNRSSQTKSKGYHAITTYDLRVATERDPLPVLQKIAEGAYGSTVVYDGNAYEQNWTFLPGGLTITYDDVINAEPEPEPEPTPEFPALPDADHGDRSPLNMTTIYVDKTNPLNAGSYYLKDSLDSEPFLDLCVLDAAKIHMQPNNAPTLHLGEDMNLVLSKPEVYIRPLQKKGIKVLLRILGDGQDIGVANMSEDQADIFTDILVWVVGHYGLNGITFDDEYAGYSSYVDNSYSRVILKLREKFATYFPNERRLITVRQWGNYGQIDAQAGAALDYADHGTYGPNVFMTSSFIAGMTNERWAPQSIKISMNYNAIYLMQMKNRSKQAVIGNYGLIMTDDMRSADDVDPLNVFSKIADGAFMAAVTYDGNTYAKDWIPSGSRTISREDFVLP